MKGIREAALTKDERNFNFDSYDRNYGYEDYSRLDSPFDTGRKTKLEDVEGQLTIKLSIPNKKIGIPEYEYGDNYSPEAISKAESIALKEISKLAGNNWQERYSYSIEDCMPMWSDVQIEILLIPN